MQYSWNPFHMDGLYWAFAILTSIVLLLTLAPFSRCKKWWIRIWEFPRLQLASLSVVLLCGQLILLDMAYLPAFAMVGITLGCLLWQVSYIAQYTPFWRRDVPRTRHAPRDRKISLLIANVEMTNRQTAALLDHIDRYDPDIVLTVETDFWWQEKLAKVSETRPHGMKCAMDNTYGMHFFSRLPVEESEIRFLVEPDVPSMHLTVVLKSGDRVKLHCLHPAPPSPTENEESTERDTELSIVARECARNDVPIIVCGDLNDVAWSRTTRAFRKTSGLLDPRRGRGLYNSFHARRPYMRWPLDHIFHSGHFSLIRLRRLPKIGSDHFPLLVELALTTPNGTGKHA